MPFRSHLGCYPVSSAVPPAQWGGVGSAFIPTLKRGVRAVSPLRGLAITSRYGLSVVIPNISERSELVGVEGVSYSFLGEDVYG